MKRQLILMLIRFYLAFTIRSLKEKKHAVNIIDYKSKLMVS